MHKCTFVLSTRDPKSPENQCNFPSKIIESLLHNRIVISTIEYEQLKGVKYFYSTSQMPLFIDNIREIASMPCDLLMTYANQGYKVSELFSTKVWNDTIKEIEKPEDK